MKLPTVRQAGIWGFRKIKRLCLLIIIAIFLLPLFLFLQMIYIGSQSWEIIVVNLLFGGSLAVIGFDLAHLLFGE